MQELLKEVASGDHSSFEKLYNRYFPKSYSLALFFTKSEYLAKETVAEVFFSIWKGREKLTGIKNWETYMYVSIRNQAIALMKKHPVRPSANVELFTVYIADKGGGPEASVIDDEVEVIAQKAFDSLPEKCRMIYYMVKEERLTYSETAEILGISERTVNSQMSIAVKKLSAIIRSYIISD